LKVRALYRLGTIDAEAGKLESSLEYFKHARTLDKDFKPDFVNLRIAEVAYKLGLID
jgi:hypothetical protein